MKILGLNTLTLILRDFSAGRVSSTLVLGIAIGGGLANGKNNPSRTSLRASSGESVYLLPEKPWSSVEISSKLKTSPRYLSLPSIKAPEITLEEPASPKEENKKKKRLREISDSGAGFVAVDPMAISGRTSKPSLPFGLVRQKIERSYKLPEISPVESLRSSTEKIQ